jgi:hypothetical protein
MYQILNIIVNLAFVHRRRHVTSDHTDQRPIAQPAIVFIRNSKGTTNQRPVGESPQLAAFGQFISTLLK